MPSRTGSGREPKCVLDLGRKLPAKAYFLHLALSFRRLAPLSLSLPPLSNDAILW